jgi:group I intron endonuclease
MKILGPNETYIYCLIYNNEVKYVGKSDNPQKRFKEHIRKCKFNKTYKDNWLHSLIKSSQRPELLILDTVPFNDFGFWEDFYINLFKSFGFKLTNLAPGGGGGNFGDEINKKISEKLKGRIINDVWRDNIKKGSVGRKHTNETKEKYSKQRTGVGNSMFGVKRERKWDENKRKKIIQLDLSGGFLNEWDSIQDAVIGTCTNRTSINYVLQNKRKSAGGYKWKYSDIY